MHLLLANNSAAGGAVKGAYESIASATGTGSSGTITFSSIPSTYQHLQIRYIAKKTTTSHARLWVRFNSDSGTSYAVHSLNGDGFSATAGGAGSRTGGIALGYTGGGNVCGSTPTNVMGAGIIDIHDYASTTRNKTVRAFSGVETNNSGSGDRINLDSGLWISTSAISSVTLYLDGSNFATTSQFALYGIKGV